MNRIIIIIIIKLKKVAFKNRVGNCREIHFMFYN